MSGLTIHRGAAGASPASDTVAGVIEIAVQAELEAASDNTRAVPPGRVQYHPGVAKFWAYVTWSGATPGVTTSRNLTSITDTATGRLTLTIATDFSSANWGGLACAEHPTSTGVFGYAIEAKAAGSCEVEYRNMANALTDPANSFTAGFGDQ